jgi:hypothetical protein
VDEPIFVPVLGARRKVLVVNEEDDNPEQDRIALLSVYANEIPNDGLNVNFNLIGKKLDVFAVLGVLARNLSSDALSRKDSRNRG